MRGSVVECFAQDREVVGLVITRGTYCVVSLSNF